MSPSFSHVIAAHVAAAHATEAPVSFATVLTQEERETEQG
jgi:hypothetical protein